jgi:hypothetical protein
MSCTVPGIFLGVKASQSIQMTTSLPSVRQLSKKYGSCNVSQPYGPATWIDFFPFARYSSNNCTNNMLQYVMLIIIKNPSMVNLFPVHFAHAPKENSIWCLCVLHWSPILKLPTFLVETYKSLRNGWLEFSSYRVVHLSLPPQQGSL